MTTENDAAARERMTAEEWAELVVDMCDGDADMTDGTRIRLKRKIGTALHAHAEQARAEERGRLTHVLQQAWDALSVVGSLELEEAEVYRRVDDAVRAIDLTFHRQHNEAPND